MDEFPIFTPKYFTISIKTGGDVEGGIVMLDFMSNHGAVDHYSRVVGGSSMT